MGELPQIDRVLKAATDRGDVPGVVAMAATQARVARRRGDDHRYGVLDRLYDKGDHLDGSNATG